MALRPYHETIIPLINNSAGWSSPQMMALVELLKSTTLPANHDAVIAAWQARVESEPGNMLENSGVVEALEAQKAANQLIGHSGWPE